MSETSEKTETATATLGICPICGKGQIVKKTAGYACNHFVNSEDKCDFIIYNTYSTKEITEEIALQIINNKETDVFTDFKSKEGNPFAASLKIDNGKVILSFKNEELDVLCPKCGTGHIYLSKKAYNCSNYKNDEIKCDFTIWRETSGRAITKEEATQLCQDKETPILTGFTKKDGTPIEGKLVIGEDFKVKLV